jgi:hypothetical protein
VNVTDLTNGVTTSLGAFHGQHDDDAIAWSPDGSRLAVENGATINVLVVRSPDSNREESLSKPKGCVLTDPVFIPHSSEVAALERCIGSDGIIGTSEAVAFDVATGKPQGLMAVAPKGSEFQGLSIDRSGQHVLLGLVGPAGGGNVELRGGRLFELSGHAPTDAEW